MDEYRATRRRYRDERGGGGRGARRRGGRHRWASHELATKRYPNSEGGCRPEDVLSTPRGSAVGDRAAP